jgi:hemerythrin
MMMPFLWNPAWDTGITAIDRQHQELLSRMGSLAEAISNGGERKEAERTLFHLSEYVETHFRSEEALMERYSYLELPKHQAIHNEMRVKVAALVESYLCDPSFVPMMVMDFLVEWLISHIGNEDRKLAEYIRKHPMS